MTYAANMWTPSVGSFYNLKVDLNYYAIEKATMPGVYLKD